MSAGVDLRPHTLVVRLDSDGDVLLAGPAVRAVAAGSRRVTLLCGPRGVQAAALLPGVDDVVVHRAPWIDPDRVAVDRAADLALADDLAGRGIDRAVVLTSWHQSALPTALLLRYAGIGEVGAVSEDYPGSLLDVRHRVHDDVHEVLRGLSTVAAMGYALPAGDDGRLRVRLPAHEAVPLPFGAPFVVVHPGASVPARAPEVDVTARAVAALVAGGWPVVVTGGPSERGRCAGVVAGAREHGADGALLVDLAGATSFAGLGHVLGGAAAVVVGNTGPAHLAAAVGTPVVSLYAPTVPAVRWRPWGVAQVLLGRPERCAGCRTPSCAVPGHPCLDVDPAAVVDAVTRVARVARTSAPRRLAAALAEAAP